MPIRNIAIIAHVDHGKTTLVDFMLKQTDTFRANQAEMSQTTILDSNDLEREKGITILAKNTAVQYGDTKINIIDTPGHADFAGEVERVIGMADGALLVVDAAEGPLPQTRFVLQEALKQNLKIIVVINKIDRHDARPKEVLAEIEELFLLLAENEEALNFSVLFAVARDGKVWEELPSSFSDDGNLIPLFEKINSEIPAPENNSDLPFKMLVSNLDFDDYKGVYAIGRVTQGKVSKGQRLAILNENERVAEKQISSIFTGKGLNRVEVAESQVGDIIAITGLEGVSIGQTLADPSDPTGYPIIKLTEPTLRMYLGPNSSPFAGKDGNAATARQIQERLEKEIKTNIGLKIETNPSGQGFMVAGRGELHLAILLETLRRENYEIEVGRPEVIIREIDAVLQEPYEELSIEIDQEYMGAIIEDLGKRSATMLDSKTDSKGIARMQFEIASKNLLGFRTSILSKTRGNGLFNSVFIGYQEKGKDLQKLRSGAITASEAGTVTAYALESLQERGQSFVKPGAEVYEGMLIGLHVRREDIEMNIIKQKKLTNFRSNADISVPLDAILDLSLEQQIDLLEPDELLEITPKNLRLRKKLLTKDQRVKAAKKLV
ncbi:MAG: translational GTPase TypA [Patescibacteria group bacterium]